MSRIGWIGCGKLGLPVCLALDAAGHDVTVWDTSPEPATWLAERLYPHQEDGVDELLAVHSITVAEFDISEACDAEVVFVAVPTPHEERFEGVTRLPEERADFDYSSLRSVLAQIDVAPSTVVAVVSTVLPGTWRSHLARVAPKRYVYNPSFIAMGTVIDDVRNPEFVLLGGEPEDCEVVAEVWAKLHDAPVLQTDITSAEAVKVAYNSFISAKIALANTWAELAERIGFDVDAVTAAWRLATDRITSGRYLAAGMGDGGACHPRDLIALSWLAQHHRLSFDLFGDLARQREAHTDWLASLIPDGSAIHGEAYKPGSRLSTGSAARLLSSFLTEAGKAHTIGDDIEAAEVNVIATAHPAYADRKWPEGSTVLDPLGIIEDQPGVTVHRIGRR